MSSVTAVPIAPTKRSYLAWLCVGIVAAVAIGLALAWVGTAKVVAERMDNPSYLAENKKAAGVTETASGLQIQTITEGTGANPTDNDVALVTYKGTLRDGSVFDQSEQPIPMPVKAMIPGFSEGLKLMKKGGSYRLWIKPELGYGPEAKRDMTGREVIPANALLIFEVQLLEFVPESVYQQMMQMRGGQGQPAPAN